MSSVENDIKRLFAEEDNQIKKITECYEKARANLYYVVLPQSITEYNKALAEELYRLGIRFVEGKERTKEDAIRSLQNVGILDENGDIKEAYKNIIVKRTKS